MNPVPVQSVHVFKRITTREYSTNNIQLDFTRGTDDAIYYKVKATFPLQPTPLFHASEYPDPDNGFKVSGLLTYNLYGNGTPCPANTSFFTEQYGILRTGIPAPDAEFRIDTLPGFNVFSLTSDRAIADYDCIITNISQYEPAFTRFGNHEQVELIYESTYTPIVPEDETTTVTTLADYYERGIGAFPTDLYPELVPFGAIDGVGSDEVVIVDPRKLHLNAILQFKTV